MRFTDLYLMPSTPAKARVNYARVSYAPARSYLRANLSTSPACVLARDGAFLTADACSSGSICGQKYKCSNGACVRASDGTYATQADCLAACSKWGCNGAGVCVPRMDGKYNSPSECRCYSCSSNACAPVADNGTGTFASLQECQYDTAAQCGWGYGCATLADGGDATNFCKRVPAPMATYATAADCRCVTALGVAGPDCVCGYDSAAASTKTKYATVTTCKDSATDQCGWKYGCNSPLSISYPAGSRPAQTYNTRTNNNCDKDFPCAKYYYFLVGDPFLASKPVGRFTIGNGSIGVSGGGGSDWSEADYVVIAYGNYEAGKPDPTTATYVSPKNGQSINVGADVVLAGTKRTINGRDTQPVAGLNNAVATLKVGWQYALCYRYYSQCDDSTSISWGASTITLSDA
jgi:hypothetical protein